ncbi:MAG: MoaD/ThiS family protein [Spirochaetia bacterium]
METEKCLHIRYYAALREAAGRAEETVRTAAATAEDLYRERARQYLIAYDVSRLTVALNDQVVPWNTRVGDGDTVIFLPPYAGG